MYVREQCRSGIREPEVPVQNSSVLWLKQFRVVLGPLMCCPAKSWNRSLTFFCPNLSLYFFESRNDFWIEMNFLRDSIRNWFGQLIRLPVTSKEKVKAWRHFTRREKSLWRYRHFFPNIYLRKKPRESNWPKALEKPFKETIIIYWKKNISN